MRWLLFGFKGSARERRLLLRLDTARQQLADEQAAHEATRRTLSVSQAECEALAAVLARDRARIEAETSTFARKTAKNEGLAHVVRNR
ncbi:hypothetical protein ETAA8_57430 [Anatilimnocola aggregata]|uniref:Uncharacterized protein n=1 Tax=Anatilimnocola aggregata TaxID=2528021 RepID=A0A517YK60_9BACT|nr:hypothetical protein [Anatilimnocola aggregata]QDU30597.1 hypothetical protein ETAA8_57430 [Anatilimnocola aggregata]